MKLRTILAATAISGLAAPAAAWAQTPPVGGGVGVGGSVPSFLELILKQPSKTTFAKFPKARTYSMSFTAEITATDAPTLLTLADGDATRGSKLGRLVSGRKRIPAPLQARVGRSGYESLAQSVDPLLTRWTDAATRAEAKVRLRQRVKRKARGSYHKLLLVTLSPDTP